MVTFNSDIDVLNYALTLENFEAALYKALIGANVLTGVEAQYLTTFGAQEQTHVDTLKGVISKLGGTPVAALAAYNFAAAGPITNRDQLVNALAAVEDIGASAYLGAAGFIKDPMLLTAAVTIHAVEAEHAAIFRDLAGMAPAPDVVAKGRTPDEVIALVTPFLQAPTSGCAPSTGSAPSTGTSTSPSAGSTSTNPPAGSSTTPPPGSQPAAGTGTGNSTTGNMGGTTPTTSTAGQNGGPNSSVRSNFIRRLGDG
ncbi:MAG: ferritin-like domain-containing protein [Chloroflexota bacterium]|nr:ferritin-like domain-containing protein [Chloroflexota bacterium]